MISLSILQLVVYRIWSSKSDQLLRSRQPEAKGRVKLSSWPSTTIFTTSTSTLMSTVTATATVTGVNPDCPDAAIPRRGGGKGQLAPIEKKMTTM